MKVDICINRLSTNGPYMGSYSISGWTSPMSFTGTSEEELIERIKDNIERMFAQKNIKMYTLNFPDIYFQEITFMPDNKKVNDTSTKKKRGRPKKNKEEIVLKSTLVPKKK